MKNLTTAWKFSISAAAEVIAQILPQLSDKAFGFAYGPTVNNQKCLAGYVHERSTVEPVISGKGIVTGKKVWCLSQIKDGNLPGLIEALKEQGIQSYRMEQVSMLTPYLGTVVNAFTFEFFSEDDYALADAVLNEWAAQYDEKAVAHN